jgi:hypothetical protein
MVNGRKVKRMDLEIWFTAISQFILECGQMINETEKVK